jgi:hypothetical protein
MAELTASKKLLRSRRRLSLPRSPGGTPTWKVLRARPAERWQRARRSRRRTVDVTAAVFARAIAAAAAHNRQPARGSTAGNTSRAEHGWPACGCARRRVACLSRTACARRRVACAGRGAACARPEPPPDAVSRAPFAEPRRPTLCRLVRHSTCARPSVGWSVAPACARSSVGGPSLQRAPDPVSAGPSLQRARPSVGWSVAPTCARPSVGWSVAPTCARPSVGWSVAPTCARPGVACWRFSVRQRPGRAVPAPPEAAPRWSCAAPSSSAVSSARPR